MLIYLLFSFFFFSLALEEEIPITDPRFYSSETLCPDSLIEHVFRATNQSNEPIPLLRERIAIMREVGYILCNVSKTVLTDRCPSLYAAKTFTFIELWWLFQRLPR